MTVLQFVRHGHRTTYQYGCPCTLCRAAEASYRAQLRARHARGLPILGSTLSAVAMQRLLRLLRKEGYTRSTLAADLGWHANYARFYAARRVTWRTAVRVRRFYRVHVLDGAEDVPLPFEASERREA